MTHIWFPSVIPWGILIFQGVLTKFHFFDEISTCGNIVSLITDLKYKHQSIFPLWGSVKLNFMDRYGKLNIFLRTQVAINFFPKILKNCHFGVKNKSLPIQMDLYDQYMFSYTIPLGYYNFLRSTSKIQLFNIISTSGKKIVDLKKDLKYEHQSTFPCGGGSNFILGTCMENQMFILRTPATVKFFT